MLFGQAILHHESEIYRVKMYEIKTNWPVLLTETDYFTQLVIKVLIIGDSLNYTQYVLGSFALLSALIKVVY